MDRSARELELAAASRLGAALEGDIATARRPELGTVLRMALLSLLLMAPLFVPPGVADLRLASPRVRSGDEPHYLVMINSLLEDGDLALEDDYAAVHAGGRHAGRFLAGAPLAHHTVWFDRHGRQRWTALFELESERWASDSEGRPVPVPVAHSIPGPPPQHEWSSHPPGLPLLFFPFLVPFSASSLIEPVAVILSGLSVVGAALLFRWLLGAWSSSARAADLATAITFLGTPVWFYAQTLFSEPLLLLLAVAAYALALRRGSNVGAGIALGLGMLVKPPFAILALPLLLLRLGRTPRMLPCLALVAPLLVAVIVLGALHQSMFGSPWRAPQEWQWGSPLEGFYGLLASSRGLIWFAPGFLVAILGWWPLIRRDPPRALVVLAGFFSYLCVMASWIDWAGGQSYGPRLIVPVIPFAFAASLAFADASFGIRPSIRRAGLALCVVSILINLLGAFGESFDAHPLHALVGGVD